MNIINTKQVVKSRVVVDSQGTKHVFNMVKDGGCYTFTWDGKKVDWSFPVCSHNYATMNYDNICQDTAKIDNMNDWVNC